MAKVLLKGNEAIAMAAIKAGCDAFFGYPITPQNEVPEYLSKHMEKEGRVFVQAESEVAAINFVYGAAGAGARVMTSSSSPGIALKQEGITYIAGAELPAVIVNVMRGGPGLGGIQPAQSDYNQITRGGGNGDYNVIAYVPETLQEMVNVIKESFDVADVYRNPVMIGVDGLIGQMMEPVDLDIDVPKRELPPKDWATTGKNGRGHKNIVNSLYLDPSDLEKHVHKLMKKYEIIKEKEQRYELVNMDNAEVVIVAYGSMARICRSSIDILKEQGVNVGMIRPISIWPYPVKAFENLPSTVKRFLCAELSAGQMIDDVRLAVNGRFPVDFFGRTGGMLPEPEEIVDKILEMRKENA
ncbi:MAG: 3-methyl-2-oxobutanoate dehydrogenase subunit VorB [Treponema sp.]|nr:MAG: 3-methyl-2-oxobutanoate dehydrogenase subunit VorB [Treponema sp.]